MERKELIEVFTALEMDLEHVFRMLNVRSREELKSNIEAIKEDTKKQYRCLALKYHPDKNDGDDTKMKVVNEAYAKVKNLRVADPPPMRVQQVMVFSFGGGFTQTSATSYTTGTSSFYWRRS